MTVVPITPTTIRRRFGLTRAGYCMVDASRRVWVHGSAANLSTGVPDFTITAPERYDPLTGLWTTLAAAPAHTYNAYSYDAAGVVYGAIETDAPGSTNACAKYDPATDAWSTIASIPNSASGRVSPAFWTTPDGLLWVCSGTTNSNVPILDTVYYNKVTNTWAAQSAAVPEQFSAQSVLRGDESLAAGCLMNAAGTVTYHVGFVNGRFYSYVMATDTWTRLADTPYTSGNLFGCIDTSDRVYLSAGANLHRYDPATGVWTTLASPSGAGRLVFQNGVIYAIGVPIQVYDIPSDTWSVTGDAWQGFGKFVWDGFGYYNIDEGNSVAPIGRLCEYWGIAAARRRASGFAQVIGD